MTDRDALRRGIREALDRASLPVFDPDRERDMWRQLHGATWRAAAGHGEVRRAAWELVRAAEAMRGRWAESDQETRNRDLWGPLHRAADDLREVLEADTGTRRNPADAIRLDDFAVRVLYGIESDGELWIEHQGCDQRWMMVINPTSVGDLVAWCVGHLVRNHAGAPEAATGETATGRVRPGAVRVWRAGDAVASTTAGAPPPEGKPAVADDAIDLYDFPDRGEVVTSPTLRVDLVVAAPPSPEGLTLARLRALVELATRAGVPDTTPARIFDSGGDDVGLEFRIEGSR